MPAPFATRDTVTDYLSGGDYEGLLPAAADPDPLDRYIARAWEVIDDNTTGMYDVDEDGNPVDDEGVLDPAVDAGLAKAVGAQIEQWFEVGEENDIAGFPGETFMSTGISVNRLPSTLAPRAARILRKLSLLAATPPAEAPIGVTLV